MQPINIFRNNNKFKEDEILIDNESFFINNIAPIKLSDTSLIKMQVIDNAVLIDKKLGTIQTPYGITDIKQLSTGCKTVINYIFLENNRLLYPKLKAIDITECGWNAIEELFKHMENSKYRLNLILRHNNKLFKCSDRKYCIDGEDIIETMFDF